MMRFIKSNPLALILILYLGFESLTSRQFNSPMDWLMDKLLILPAILIGLSFHEFAHAFAADRLGDSTPKLQGRVTINPIAHLDLFGFLALFFIGFGWGKAVQVNPWNFKNFRRDSLIVDLAGVTVNLILAIIFAGVFKLLYLFQLDFLNTYMGSVVAQLLHNIISINVVLMVFNLLPVPPLDGFGVVTELFDLRKKDFYYPLYQNGFMILLALMIFGVTDKILVPAVNVVYQFVFRIYF